MKTNPSARRVYRARLAAGLGIILMLAIADFCVVSFVKRHHASAAMEPAQPQLVLSLGDCLAAN